MDKTLVHRIAEFGYEEITLRIHVNGYIQAISTHKKGHTTICGYGKTPSGALMDLVIAIAEDSIEHKEEGMRWR